MGHGPVVPHASPHGRRPAGVAQLPRSPIHAVPTDEPAFLRATRRGRRVHYFLMLQNGAAGRVRLRHSGNHARR